MNKYCPPYVVEVDGPRLSPDLQRRGSVGAVHQACSGRCRLHHANIQILISFPFSEPCNCCGLVSLFHGVDELQIGLLDLDMDSAVLKPSAERVRRMTIDRALFRTHASA